MFSNIEVVKQKFAKLEKEYKDEGKSEEEIAKVSVTAVSYTHLDVYKRQF